MSGDADFVPALKLARCEGLDVILEPMGQHINPSLFEHIDGLGVKRKGTEHHPPKRARGISKGFKPDTHSGK